MHEKPPSLVVIPPRRLTRSRRFRTIRKLLLKGSFSDESDDALDKKSGKEKRKREVGERNFPWANGMQVDEDEDEPDEANDVQADKDEAGEEEHDHGSDMDRATVRLDGLEVYAVVSALSSATLIQFFDSFISTSLRVLWEEQRFIELVGDLVFIIASSTGIVAGLHATLVFSLMTMYGRTALGMGRHEALDIFFAKSGLQRYRGFQTFLYSLYAFLVQVLIKVTTKCPSEIQLVAFICSFIAISMVYKDTKEIVFNAAIIYVPPPQKSPEPKLRLALQQRNTPTRHSSVFRPAVGWR
jgi:hypothetical protein